jgi:hypothetical protein
LPYRKDHARGWRADGRGRLGLAEFTVNLGSDFDVVANVPIVEDVLLTTQFQPFISDGAISFAAGPIVVTGLSVPALLAAIRDSDLPAFIDLFRGGDDLFRPDETGAVKSSRRAPRRRIGPSPARRPTPHYREFSPAPSRRERAPRTVGLARPASPAPTWPALRPPRRPSR